MDLVNYDQDAYDKVVREYSDFASKLNVKDVRFIPISALHGDNVVNRGDQMPWHEGGTLLHNLETRSYLLRSQSERLSIPVQTVIRPHSDTHHDFRGYAGASGRRIFKKGDPIIALPSGLTTKFPESHHVR